MAMVAIQTLMGLKQSSLIHANLAPRDSAIPQNPIVFCFGINFEPIHQE